MLHYQCAFFTFNYSSHFLRREDERETCLIIIQCDFGHVDGDLIACARYRIYDMRAKALLQFSSGLRHTTHVLFIIHLPVQAVQSSFVGFQGDPWVSCHIDELRRSCGGTLTFEVAQGAAISELFYGGPRRKQPPLPERLSQFAKKPEDRVFHRVAIREEGEDVKMEKGEKEEDKMLGASESREGIEQGQVVQSKQDDEVEEEEAMEEGEKEKENDVEREDPIRTTAGWEGEEGVACRTYMQCTRLNSCIQAAASRLQDSTQNKHRATKRVEVLIYHIPQEPSLPLGE